ncbi:MAG: hypothetical protein HKN35_15830 [Woeseia sp.]|nr:hypothetical protein [Woeseia sp.]
MADLTQTAANVGLTDTAGSTVAVKQAGEALTQGQPVYLNTADSKYYKCDANVSAVTAAAAGICMSPAATDEYFILCSAGPIDLGGTLAIGTTYIVSATAGGVAPDADAATGWFKTALGHAIATDRLELDINASGVAVP